MYFAGIDAGQSTTQAAIADAGGNVIGRGSAGPADEIGATADSTRLRDALEGSLSAALRDAALPEDQRLAAVVAGISGYEGRIYGHEPHLNADRIRLVHDAPIAHAGALAGAPGVVVIAGTGSVAFALEDDGSTATFGGWGYLFGDEGSAFWIARNGIANVLNHAACEERTTLLEFFGASNLRSFARNVYSGEISRDRVAAFARVCIEAAAQDRGCECLRGPALAAGGTLAVLAVTAAGKHLRDVAFVGGLMHDVWFRQRAYDALRAGLPDVRIHEPKEEPVIGALLLARQL